jgi:Zn-dependent peptidase ImmA (M78 family)
MIVGKLQKIFTFPPLNVPKYSATTNEQIESAAEETRKYWKLDADAPIYHVARVLEHAGVLIVPHLVHSKEVDAFSRNGCLCVIFLNQAIPSTSRWVFDIAHECGHLLMHPNVITGSKETEAAADRFASAFLLPRNAFSREFRARSFSWDHVFRLKRRWHVSAAAIVRRAYDLALLGAAGYRQAYKYMSWKSWNSQGEPYEPEFQEPKLLSGMLGELGKSVKCTLLDLCQELRFTPEAFREVTGVSVPLPYRTPVIALSRR